MALLATLGVSEGALVAAGAATHRVGTRFAWGAAPFAIAEGDGWGMIAGAALHQLWWAHGGDGAFDALVPGAVLALADRFVHPVEDARSPLSRIDYALRLDAERALPVFAAAARAARVRAIAAARIEVLRAGDAIAIAAGGERIDADLFVDASGPAAVLAAADTRWIDWSATLPVDRLLLGTAPPRPSPADGYEAIATGWTARWPLATRTLTGMGYAAAVTGDARARKAVAGDMERIVVRPGRQAAAFVGNVVALGDAAASVGPLGWPGLPLALAQLKVVLELMPARDDEPLLRAEYERRAGLLADRAHAYAAAFYLVGARRGPFWHPLRTATPPRELADALAQFGRRGTLPPLEEQHIARAAWQQALIGLGVRPERHDPVALSVPRASAIAGLAQLRAAIAALPATLPPYPDYLATMMRGRR